MEFSHRSGRDLINVAKKRTNVIPVIEDARHPHKYRMLIGGRILGVKKGNLWVRVMFYGGGFRLFCVVWGLRLSCVGGSVGRWGSLGSLSVLGSWRAIFGVKKMNFGV